MNMPTWQRELENFIGIKPLFVLEGNVSDLYPWDCEGQTQFLPLAHILPELFAAPDGTRPYRFLYVDPLRGVHDPLGTGEVRALAQAAQREAERLTAEAEALNPGAASSPLPPTASSTTPCSCARPSRGGSERKNPAPSPACSTSRAGSPPRRRTSLPRRTPCS